MFADRDGDVLFADTSDDECPLYGSIQQRNFQIADSLAEFLLALAGGMSLDEVDFSFESRDDDMSCKPDFLAKVATMAHGRLGQTGGGRWVCEVLLRIVVSLAEVPPPGGAPRPQTMTSNKELNLQLLAALAQVVDTPLLDAGFIRRKGATIYTRTSGPCQQSIAFVMDTHPRYQPGSEAHLHPMLQIAMPCVSEDAQSLVKGDRTRRRFSPALRRIVRCVESSVSGKRRPRRHLIILETSPQRLRSLNLHARWHLTIDPSCTRPTHGGPIAAGGHLGVSPGWRAARTNTLATTTSVIRTSAANRLTGDALAWRTATCLRVAVSCASR